MSSINGDMSAAMWKNPDRHESLKKIEYIEGDWQTMPISLLHQLSDHLDHEGDVDFASTLWPKKDPIRLDRTNQGKAAKYQLEGAANDQKLKAARFSYSAGKTKKQITVVGVPDEQDPTRIEPVIVRHRKGHSVCNPGGMSGWDGNKQEIWRPIHKRSEANEGPERTILRITERKDPIVRPAPSASAIEQPVAASEPDQHLGNQQETCGDAGCEQQDSSPAREDQSANEDRLQLGKRKRSDSAISIASSIKSEPPEDSIYNPLGQHLQREDVAQRARDEDEETQCTTDSGPDPAVQHSLSQNPTSFDTFDPDFSQRTSLASSATTVVGSTPSTPTPPASKPIDRRYKNVGVIFFDINNQVRQGYNLPFSECSSARDLFDAARVAKVADKHTRTLEYTPRPTRKRGPSQRHLEVAIDQGTGTATIEREDPAQQSRHGTPQQALDEPTNTNNILPSHTDITLISVTTPIKQSNSRSSSIEASAPADQYGKILVAFKDGSDTEQEKETLDTYETARDLFDAACAAKIATPATRLLEVKVSDKEHEVIRKDNQPDFEKKVLAVVNSLLFSKTRAEEIVVVVKPYM